MNYIETKRLILLVDGIVLSLFAMMNKKFGLHRLLNALSIANKQ